MDPLTRHHHLSCVHKVFDVCARRWPEDLAVVVGTHLLTYRQLERRADTLAQRLRKLGLRRGARVGVCYERCPELIVSILGILKAGAAYVPLDPEYPADRLGFMLADAQVSALVAKKPPVGIIPNSIPVLNADDCQPESNEAAADALSQSPNDPAYLMYTSGSTGQPKGVVVPHRGITRLVCEPDFVDISKEDVFLQLAPGSFDASTFEIWGALLNGARLAMMPPGHVSLQQIGEAIRREGVTIMWLTAGLFNLMVDERLDDLRPLKQLLIGGETLSVAHVEKARAALRGTQLINGYGPTENTTFTCCHRIGRFESFPHGVPIGRPIRGTRVKIVNDQSKEVHAGEEGELLAGGEGLALGYWNRPELTAERFIKDPTDAGSGEIFYRTGDYVRLQEDGNIEFLGRRDGQVKLRGFRIETGEVEATIRTHEGVRDCAVKVSRTSSGQERLVAYVVPKALATILEQELSTHTASRLPEHMQPEGWVFLQRLPLNPNGKVDREALPEFDPRKHAEPQDFPRNEIERLISAVWEEALDVRPVPATVSYFELGGNSLLMTQVHERLRQRFDLPITLTDLFRFPTVRSLAEHLVKLETEPAGASIRGISGRAEMNRAALGRFKKAHA